MSAPVTAAVTDDPRPAGIDELEFPVPTEAAAERLRASLLGRPIGRRGVRLRVGGRWHTLWFAHAAYVRERGALVVAVIEEGPD
jgi:hypothetical protein